MRENNTLLVAHLVGPTNNMLHDNEVDRATLLWQSGIISKTLNANRGLLISWQ